MGRSVKKRKPNRGRSRALLAALTVLLLILAAGLVLGGVLLIAPLTERPDGTAVDGSADWMRRLNDEQPLNEIALPGTHNSAAVYTPYAFFTKCQAMSIREQLEAGFRYLDLRLGATEARDGFRLLHGAYPCQTRLFGKDLTFDEVLAQCRAFLDEHPSETVLLALKLEDDSLTTRECQFLLDAYVREDPEAWLLTDRIPTLGQARGKLVLLRRWEDEVGLRKEAGIPLRWRDQGGFEDTGLNAAAEEQGFYMLYVQDRYEYDADAKWEAFLAGIRMPEEGAVSLNYLSTKGETRYGHPYEYAKELNARLLEADEDALDGWILVDFGSAPLAEKIYRHNNPW